MKVISPMKLGLYQNKKVNLSHQKTAKEAITKSHHKISEERNMSHHIPGEGEAKRIWFI